MSKLMKTEPIDQSFIKNLIIISIITILTMAFSHYMMHMVYRSYNEPSISASVDILDSLKKSAGPGLSNEIE
jgi:hypothetical protein